MAQPKRHEAEASATSPERATLATAFAKHVERQAATAALARAIGPAQQAVWAAVNAVDAADPALARQEAVKHLVAVARGAAGPAPLSPRDTRIAQAAAQDELEVARAVLAKIQEEHRELSAWPSFSWGKLQEAAHAVLRVESGPDKGSITPAMCTAAAAALMADPDARVEIGWASLSTPLPPDRR